MVGGSIGRHIATCRRRRGLSQVALAGLVGRSESWLSQVERGIRSVDRMSVVLDLARVLCVEPKALMGTPWRLGSNGACVGSDLDDLRSVFTAYESVVGEPGPAAVTVAEVRAEVGALHAQYQSAQFSQVLARLPGMLSQVDRLHGDSRSTDCDASLVYVEAYVLAAKFVIKFGDNEFATVAADRSIHVAATTGSPVAVALGVYQVAHALLRNDRVEEADRVTMAMAERAYPALRADNPDLVSAVGSLWLLGAVIAARRADRCEALERLGRAEQLAGLLGRDSNHGFTAFGPTNVAIHRVSVAADLGDPGGAMKAAAVVDPNLLPVHLVSRRARVHIDLALVNSRCRRDAEATLQLLEAERLAPETIRYNATAREMVLEMLARSTKVQSRALIDLATRGGLLN